MPHTDHIIVQHTACCAGEFVCRMDGTLLLPAGVVVGCVATFYVVYTGQSAGPILSCRHHSQTTRWHPGEGDSLESARLALTSSTVSNLLMWLDQLSSKWGNARWETCEMLQIRMA